MSPHHHQIHLVFFTLTLTRRLRMCCMRLFARRDGGVEYILQRGLGECGKLRIGWSGRRVHFPFEEEGVLANGR